MKFNTSLLVCHVEENFAHACGLALDTIREHMVSSTAQTFVNKKKSFIAFFGYYFKSDFTYWCIAVIAKYLPIPKRKKIFFSEGWGSFELVECMRASLVEPVASGRGFSSNDARKTLVEWDPFGEVSQTEFVEEEEEEEEEEGGGGGGGKKILTETGIFRIKEVEELLQKSRNLSALQSGQIQKLWRSSSSRRMDDTKVKRVAIVLPFTGDTKFEFRRRVAKQILMAKCNDTHNIKDEETVVLIPEFAFYGNRKVVGQTNHILSNVSEYILMHLIGLREACGLIEWARDTYGDGVSIAIGGSSMGGYIATGAGILASRAFHMDDDTNTKKKSSNRANKKLGVVSVCSWHNFEKSFAPNSYLYLRLDREQVLIKDSYVENMISEILISSESEGSTSSSLPIGRSIFQNLNWKAVLNRAMQLLVGIDCLVKAGGGAQNFENKLDTMVNHFSKRDRLITSDYDEIEAIKSRCTSFTKPRGVVFTYDPGDHLSNVLNPKAAIVPAFLEAFNRMESS